MANNPKGLGKGLAALLGDDVIDSQEEKSSLFLPISQVESCASQPRKQFDPESLADLADSIREHGIIQPLTVRKLQSGYYQIIAGERRWRAARMAGLTQVPAIIIEADDRKAMELAMIENLQRENLSPLEEAAGYMRLKTEFRMKQGDIAKRVGKSRAAVANSMRLLDLPQPVQDMLGNTFISVGHAKVLLSLKNKDQQIQLGRDIVNKGYTVRQTEKAIQKMLNPPDPAPAKKPSSPQYKKISGILAKQFGTPVNISGQGSRGSIEITFSSKAEFIRILELLGQDEWPDSK